VSGGWSVRRRTSSLEMRARQGIRSMRRRHHWSNASRFLASCRIYTHDKNKDKCDEMNQELDSKDDMMPAAMSDQ